MCNYTQIHHLLCGCRTYRVFRCCRCIAALRNGYDCPNCAKAAAFGIEGDMRCEFCQEGLEEEALVTEKERALEEKYGR